LILQTLQWQATAAPTISPANSLSATPPQSTKKFRSSRSAKGCQITRRLCRPCETRGGEDGDEESDKVQRVKALEEMMKLQQIDEATFVKLREEILGDEWD
jgi:hypothetical protein